MIYVVAFDPIKIQTCLAPQNDCQNLSFVKDIYVVGEKMTRNCHKMSKLKIVSFESKRSILTKIAQICENIFFKLFFFAILGNNYTYTVKKDLTLLAFIAV